MSKTRKILIVEDDQTISIMYKAKFETEGFSVLSASTGVDGLNIAKKEKPSIIMLDIVLPQMDGFSVLKKLKAGKETKKIPVIMLTNLGTEEDVKKGKELGADDYLVKASLTPTQVSNKVKSYIDKSVVKKSVKPKKTVKK